MYNQSIININKSMISSCYMIKSYFINDRIVWGQFDAGQTYRSISTVIFSFQSTLSTYIFPIKVSPEYIFVAVRSFNVVIYKGTNRARVCS